MRLTRRQLSDPGPSSPTNNHSEERPMANSAERPKRTRGIDVSEIFRGRLSSASSVAALVVAAGGVLVLSAGLALAATGPTHATVGPFHYQSNDFKIDSKGTTEVVMPTFSIAPGTSNKWHTHPGPGFIIVTQGTLTLYRALDDGSCAKSVYNAGEGYVEAP